MGVDTCIVSFPDVGVDAVERFRAVIDAFGADTAPNGP
jgi:hypothetical protein